MLRLVRSSHTFAAVVRETLETDPSRRAGDQPLSFSQVVLLRLMSFDGEHHVGQAAEFLGVSAAAATKNVDKLERLGLVARSPSSDDRRATLLSVSAKGRRLVDRGAELEAACLTEALAGYSLGEMMEMSRFLDRFATALMSCRRSLEGPCLRCAAYLDDDCAVGRLRGGCPHEPLRAEAARRTQAAAVGTEGTRRTQV